jgi:hypothetical protein
VIVPVPIPHPERWLRVTPGGVALLLLATEAFLWASERFQVLAFNRHKGCTAVVALAAVAVFLLLMLGWFLLAAVFRWRFQFGLRSLLVLPLVVALVCGWLATEIKRAKRQRELVAEIEGAGGLARCDYEFDGSGRWIANAEPPWPRWLRRALGDGFFASVTHVAFQRVRIGDAGLEHVNEFPELERLFLEGAEITDAGLAHVKGLIHLRLLVVIDSKVGDSGLQHIEGLAHLQLLWLNHTEVSDAGLEHLRGLAELRSLGLSDTRVGDAGLEHLQGLSQLQLLDLDGTNVSDAGLEHLKGLARLQNLGVSFTKVTDAGLERLRRLTSLRTLRLFGTRATPLGVARLQQALPKCEIFYSSQPATRRGKPK